MLASPCETGLAQPEFKMPKSCDIGHSEAEWTTNLSRWFTGNGQRLLRAGAVLKVGTICPLHLQNKQ
jgi:hypothetical protein